MGFQRGEDPIGTLGIGLTRLRPVYEIAYGKWAIRVTFDGASYNAPLYGGFETKEQAERNYDKFIKSKQMYNFHGRLFRGGVEIVSRRDK